MLSTTHIGKAGGLVMPPDWLLKGLPGSGGESFPQTPQPDAFRQRRDRKKLRIANFASLTGPAGIWGPSATNSTLLAASEINRRGGILGREIEIVFHDTGGSIEDVVRTASDVVASEEADIIMGSHISAVRVALRKVVAGRIPYVYTPVYEGGERTPGVMAIGETPRAQSRPAIEWLASAKRASRWYLIGSDYVWPWLSHRATKKYIADAGGSVVGEEFVRMGEHDHSAHLARIRAAKPDVVLISLIGTDSIVFNRAFAEQGLASKMLRLAGAMDETVLLGIGADNTENLFCASGYFVDMASRENDAFRCQYQASYGRYAPPPGSVGQSNYEGLRFLDTVASQAGTLAIKPLLSTAMNVDYVGARGRIGVRRGSASMPIYLAEADGLDFQLIKRF
ncbi:substrate-binding domain-containing protein [Bradyrhizobium canariense]|uniref:Amino acid/amide ABC transporter substrate-binding protein, HAAT family n=1 Tax=Bradyrhizobium canariense TaxID=255045 RepID=A0A1H1UPJ2_9BRAD|nr:substrate-binding domain-containing protein [Bradyrhizobium canariense]SDS74200.1 amino acid/amide ABC transporter substrate-binding protein, HAAT family [Bradyrhizobium canariense]